MLKKICMKYWIKLHSNEEGASAVEYGLVVALIAVAIIAGATLLGTNIGSLFTKVGDKVGVVVP